MTTSGITTTEMTRNEIILAALRKLGIKSPTSTQITDTAEALNNLVAEFQTLGMPLWAKKETAITMVASQATYTIGIGQTNNFAFPLKILQAWTEPNIGGGKQPLMPLGIYDYNLLPTNTTSTGIPSQFDYSPKINYGILSLWPAPDSSCATDRTLYISYQSPFEVFSVAGDTPYFPREWNNALIYGTALLMSPEFGTPIQDRNDLERQAEGHKNIALDFGLEEASITIAPEIPYN